jgi:hypothetical protein
MANDRAMSAGRSEKDRDRATAAVVELHERLRAPVCPAARVEKAMMRSAGSPTALETAGAPSK